MLESLLFAETAHDGLKSSLVFPVSYTQDNVVSQTRQFFMILKNPNTTTEVIIGSAYNEFPLPRRNEAFARKQTLRRTT